MPSSTKQINDLQVLRAFAVGTVILHHAVEHLYQWLSPAEVATYAIFNGGVGVDLFFAISGYIIARNLIPTLDACESNRQWLTVSLAFWVKRIYRLLPSAWFWLFALLLLSAFFNDSGVFGSLRSNFEATIAGILQVANFRLADAWGNYPYGASFVYWSLSLEEQFYLLLPFVAWFGRKYLPWIIAFVIAFQMLQQRSVLGMMVRTDALLLGVLIALWSNRDTYRLVEPVFLLKWPLRGFPLLLVLVCLMLIVASDRLNIVPLNWSLVSILAALLVWVASYDRDVFMLRGPLGSLLLWMGSRSYAMYLIHIPAFYFTGELMYRLMPDTTFGAENFWVFTVVAFSIIVVCSELNYRILEEPIRRRGARVARQLLERRQASQGPANAEGVA